VFDLVDDESVRIMIAEPPPDLAAAVKDAVAACPKQALHLADE
jgi:ferredoxin